MIELKNLKFTYAGEKNPSLTIENLEFPAGQCVVLSGASGSGKSTLTKVINALIPNFFEGDLDGQVALDGKDARQMDVCAVSNIVSSVFQDPASQFFTEAVDSELAFTCENFGLEQEQIIDNIANAVELVEIQELLGHKLEKLSGGQMQKIAIATALTLPVKVLILDEPSSNLDYNAIQRLGELLQSLKTKGFTILVAEHRLYYLRDFFDRFLYMKDGQILHDYTRDEFLQLDTHKLNELGLRRLDLFSENRQTNQPEDTNAPNAKDKNIIAKFENISFSYPKAEQKIIDNLGFSVQAGDIIALVGANGAGKTTLAKILTGVLRAKTADFYFAPADRAEDLKKVKAKNLHKQVNFVMQNVSYQMFGESAFSELRLGNEDVENLDEKIHFALENLGLGKLKNTHPFSLSMGQRQRLVLASTFVGQKMLTILDEPTSGLDFLSMTQVSSIISQIAAEGKGVIIITHDYELISQTCNRAILLKDGKIAKDMSIQEDKTAIAEIFKNQLGV